MKNPEDLFKNWQTPPQEELTTPLDYPDTYQYLSEAMAFANPERLSVNKHCFTENTKIFSNETLDFLTQELVAAHQSYDQDAAELGSTADIHNNIDRWTKDHYLVYLDSQHFAHQQPSPFPRNELSRYIRSLPLPRIVQFLNNMNSDWILDFFRDPNNRQGAGFIPPEFIREHHQELANLYDALSLLLDTCTRILADRQLLEKGALPPGIPKNEVAHIQKFMGYHADKPVEEIEADYFQKYELLEKELSQVNWALVTEMDSFHPIPRS